MRNLGKLLILVALASVPSLAALSAAVDSEKVMMGEQVTLKIVANGDDVKPPLLSTICGSKITSSSQGTSIQAINGSFTKSYTFAYQFTPSADCVIDPITIEIDGKAELTDAIAIDVVPMQITKDSPFILEMASEKSEVYVGEPFKVTVLFKQKRNSDVVDSKFAPPDFSGFWTKEQQQSRRFEEGGYTISRLHFIVAAQQAGKQAINPSQIQIATRTHSRDAWGQWLSSLKWRSYFSNALEIDVKPLPEGVTLVGDLNITAKADKTVLEPNEAVNLSLRISGSGNFEDIGSLKPNLSQVAVYAEEPDIKAYIENGRYKGSWNEKLAFVSDRSFTIPSFTLRYFDPESKRVKSVSTEPIAIEVKGAKAVEAPKELTIKRPESKEEAPEEVQSVQSAEINTVFVMGMLFGIVVGVVSLLLPWRKVIGKREKADRVDMRDDRELLKFLLHYQDDPEACEFAEQLEAVIYSGASVDIERKKLKKVVKRLQEG